MNDLIRRQDAIDALRNNRMLPFGEHPAYNRAMRDSENVIRKLQSAQPDIIRCKDCKHWREGTMYAYCDILYGMGVLDAYDYMTTEDDFCSQAERRTDG